MTGDNKLSHIRLRTRLERRQLGLTHAVVDGGCQLLLHRWWRMLVTEFLRVNVELAALMLSLWRLLLLHREVH